MSDKEFATALKIKSYISSHLDCKQFALTTKIFIQSNPKFLELNEQKQKALLQKNIVFKMNLLT